MHIYLNVKGHVFETDQPVEVIDANKDARNYFFCRDYIALYDKQQNAEEKHNGYYRRCLSYREGEIKNNSLWLKEADLEKAKSIFYKDIMDRYNKINKKFNSILDEKERFESE